MKTPLIISLLALVLSVVAIVSMLVGTGVPESREESAVVPVASDPTATLLTELEALRQRVAELEMIPASAQVERAPAPDGYVSKEDFFAFREEVLGALDGSSLVSSIQGPEFKDTLEVTLDEINRDQAIEKTNASYQMRVDGIDERMAQLDAKLDLSRQQSGALREELLTRYERDADMSRRWHEGEDPEVIGELKMTNNQAHQDALSLILTPEQLESYRSLGRWGGRGK